jgi:basic membrane protein A
MDKWVMDTTQLALDGKFKGENYSGTLENGGVDLAMGAAFKDKIPADLAKEIDGLKADIVAGKQATLPK